MPQNLNQPMRRPSPSARTATPSMRRRLVMALTICSLGLPIGVSSAAPEPRDVPVPHLNHILVVIMENHSYDEVRTAPFTAGLIAGNSAFAASYALTHPSQPNYIDLWSGSNQLVVDDYCPAPGSPFSTENLGHACEATGISWKAYCENLPAPGWTGCNADGNLYARRHCPWANFGNLNHLNERPYSELATDLINGTLPSLAFVIPNNCHNTHDCDIATGDAWLAANLPPMIDGVGPQGLVILTWDEDDNSSGNHILTVFAGGSVQQGYTSTRTITHYTVLRTLTDALGILPIGAARNETPITDVWIATDPASVPGGLFRPPLLGPAHPNPSSGIFEAALSLRPGLPVDASIFDAGGRFVARTVRLGDPRAPTIRWDGRNEEGRLVRTGLYFLRVRAGNRRAEQKLIVER
jgi:phosphatidylinositol-3-phosphatase